MKFIGPELVNNGGYIKEAIESMGEYFSDVVLNDILEQAQLPQFRNE